MTKNSKIKIKWGDSGFPPVKGIVFISKNGLAPGFWGISKGVAPHLSCCFYWVKAQWGDTFLGHFWAKNPVKFLFLNNKTSLGGQNWGVSCWGAKRGYYSRFFDRTVQKRGGAHRPPKSVPPVRVICNIYIYLSGGLCGRNVGGYVGGRVPPDNLSRVY